MKFKFSAKYSALIAKHFRVYEFESTHACSEDDVHTTSIFGIISIHTFEIGSLSGLREMQNVVSPDYYEDS